MNAKKRKVTTVSESPVADDSGKLSEDPGETVNSENLDPEIPYWPAADDEQKLIDTQESERFLLNWVPEAESKIRKPHIGVSRWTSWRRKREMETRAKQMNVSNNLFDLWNMDREVRASSQELEKEAESEIDQARHHVAQALRVLRDYFRIDAPNRCFEKALKETTKIDFMRCICVCCFLSNAMQKKQPAVTASADIAKAFFPEMNHERRGRKNRICSGLFLQEHRLPDINQGFQTKKSLSLRTRKRKRAAEHGFERNEPTPYEAGEFSNGVTSILMKKLVFHHQLRLL